MVGAAVCSGSLVLVASAVGSAVSSVGVGAPTGVSVGVPLSCVGASAVAVAALLSGVPVSVGGASVVDVGVSRPVSVVAVSVTDGSG